MTTTRFPFDPVAARRTRRRRRVRRTALAAGVAVVVAAGAGVTAMAVSSRDGSGLRTAAVATRTLDTTVSGVATIEPVTQAAVAFTDGGTVVSVDAAVGDQVTAGQPLAALDVTQLQSQLHDKQAALTQAQLVLTKALAGEDVSALLRTGGGGMTRDVSMVVAPAIQPTFTLVAAVGSDDIAAGQQAVVAGQQRVDQARSAAAAALDSATDVCAAVGADVDPSDPAGATSTIQACQDALQHVVDAQGGVQDAQRDLAAAAAQLDDLLSQYASDLQSTPTPTTEAPTTTTPAPTTTTPSTDDSTSTTPATTTPASDDTTPTTSTTPGDGRSSGRVGGGTARSGSGGGGGTTGGASTGGGSATVSSPSSADLIAYQQAVDAAYADLVATQQELARATIASPIDGTVVAVDLAVGEDVAAGSATQRIVVQGAGGYEAAVSLPLDDIAHVQVGQAATLVPDGAATPISGTVVAIAAQPDASSSPTTYRVTVSLAGGASGLRNGALGTLSVVTATATDALAVPSSAVSTVGARHVVRVVDGSTTTETRVEVGVVGATWTQITGGLTAGQQVVVADLGAPLPTAVTSADQTTSRAVERTLGGGFVRPGG